MVMKINLIISILIIFLLYNINCQIEGSVPCNEQQIATRFFSPFCNKDKNNFQYQIQNGHSIPLNFTVILQCFKNINSTQVIEVNPFTITPIFNISPATGTVENRLCSLILETLDICSDNLDTFLNKTNLDIFKTSCGLIDNNDLNDDDDNNDSSKCSCTYFDEFCRLENGCWYHSFILYMIILFYFTIIFSIFMLFFFIIPKKRKYKKFLSKYKKKQYENNNESNSLFQNDSSLELNKTGSSYIKKRKKRKRKFNLD